MTFDDLVIVGLLVLLVIGSVYLDERVTNLKNRVDRLEGKSK